MSPATRAGHHKTRNAEITRLRIGDAGEGIKAALLGGKPQD